MRLGRLSYTLLFLWVSTASASDVTAQTLVETPAVSQEKLRIVDLNGQRHDLHDMKGGKASVMSGVPSSANKFSQADLTEAVESILREHPELILEALEKKPVAFVELIQRASILREVKAKEERRLRELKQPKMPAIDTTRPMRGNPDATVTIVEYSDFECPFCRSASSTVKEVLQQYGDNVRFVYKHNPLNFHPMAEPAARYFEAIALQDVEAAWRFHDQVFEQQDQLTAGEETLRTIVVSLNVDDVKVEHDLHGEAVERRLSLDREEAERFGFDGTPAFLINGVSLMGSQPKEDFEEIIRMSMPENQRAERVAAQDGR